MAKPAYLADSVKRATSDVFSMMLGMEVEALPYRFEAEPEHVSGGILGLIGFSGAWSATATVCCTPAMACRIADALFLTPHSAVEDEVLDAVAEMANMIIGNVKTDLENHLGMMSLSIPTVIYGKNFIKRTLIKDHWVVAPFQAGDEILEVHICLIPTKTPEEKQHAFNRAFLHV
ncbi:MAG: chemotaxis protein CheX [Bryobacterales bacterium]|nr:chemotaxis protein CheX [Bryobacterales bacterium]